MTRFGLGVVLAALACGPMAHAQAPVPDLKAVETQVLERTNAYRRKNGLPPLTSNPQLTAAARDFAAYMARASSFSHTADGREPADRLAASGYGWCEYGENLGLQEDSRGFTAQRLSGGFVDGWIGSPPHRKNMLAGNVTQIGVGVARGPREASRYIAVQEFGRPASMRVEFKIDNRSGRPVAYHYAGQRGEATPGGVISYTSCSADRLSFDTGGGQDYQPRDGQVYVLSPSPDGVRVEVQSADAPR